MQNKTTNPILRIRDLCVAFDNGAERKIAVDGVSLDVFAGERVALVGESGSGKTVTALSVLGLLPDAHTTGEIVWSPTGAGAPAAAGKDLLSCSPRELLAIRGKDIAMVFQEPMSALNPLFTVGQQIAEVLELHEGLSAKQALERAVALLERTGVDDPQRRANAYPHQLSGGQRQRVVIAMALACSPKLLIADEPTTALDVTIRAQVLELLAELQREEGMAILLITHDLPLVEKFAQRVGVMQLGKLVEEGDTHSVFMGPKHDYTKRLLNSRPKRMVEASVARDVILSASKVRCEYDIPTGWFSKRHFIAVGRESLTLSRGETLGIVGESGSGKTTLGMAMLRLSSATVTGEVRFGNDSLYKLSTNDMRRLRRHLQIVFQDPFSALSPRMTVGQIIGEGLALHFPELSESDRRERIAQMLEEVGLPADSAGRYPHEFSGGQRQRIAIARAVILQPEVILLDEPTSALDVSIQQQVLELLVSLQKKHGVAYLFITHDLAVIKAIAHRVMVMRGGEVVESGYTEEVLSRPREEYTWQLVNAAL
jgi:microcin C transport system ATP-binding protein